MGGKKAKEQGWRKGECSGYKGSLRGLFLACEWRGGSVGVTNWRGAEGETLLSLNCYDPPHCFASIRSTSHSLPPQLLFHLTLYLAAIIDRCKLLVVFKIVATLPAIFIYPCDRTTPSFLLESLSIEYYQSRESITRVLL